MPGWLDRWASSGQTTLGKVFCGRWRSARAPNEMPCFDESSRGWTNWRPGSAAAMRANPTSWLAD